jgi:hypothetical protein
VNFFARRPLCGRGKRIRSRNSVRAEGARDTPAARCSPPGMPQRAALDLRCNRQASAYFTNASWWSSMQTLLSNPLHSGSAVVIVTGSNSGPDVPTNSTLVNNINTLHSHNIKAIGYVNNATPHVYQLLNQPDRSIPPATVAQQIHTWIEQYHADGIFFDLSWRMDQDLNDQDLANAEGFVALASQLVQNWKGDWMGATTMFNWSVPYPQMQRYVDCTLSYNSAMTNGLFVSQETSRARYGTNDPSWAWIYNYMPVHFAHILNSVGSTNPGTFLPQMEATARQRNAEYFFFTDQASYSALPTSAVWKSDISNDNRPYSDYGGVDQDNRTYVSFPDQCPYAASFP